MAVNEILTESRQAAKRIANIHFIMLFSKHWSDQTYFPADFPEHFFIEVSVSATAVLSSHLAKHGAAVQALGVERLAFHALLLGLP